MTKTRRSFAPEFMREAADLDLDLDLDLELKRKLKLHRGQPFPRQQ
ncbi:hypothetical protein PS865_04463 [Pseudomonas fluorescens]|nr:hypothetical protein PS865_04463 [Pseudomonas fluorescens]